MRDTDLHAWSVAVPVGYRLGDWEVRRPIAAGAWGSVYEGRRTTGGEPRSVALKFLPTGTMTPRQLAHLSEMVRREVTLHGALSHPRIIPLLDTLVVDDAEAPGLDGSCVLVMELAARSLEDQLRAARGDPLPQGAGMILQICEGLEHLHRSGHVHGDVKPSNVLVMPDGSVKLADFGLATELEGTHAYLAPMGSPDYMPPERWTEELTDRGVAVRPTADIWALGVTAHQILTGQQPFAGGTPRIRAARAAEYAAARAPLTLSTGLSPGWQAFVRDCLAPDHESRAGWDATVLRRRAEDLLADPSAQPRPPRRRRAPVVLAMAGALTVLTGGTAVWLALPGPAPRDYGRWLNTGSDIPRAYYDLVVDAGTRCDEPGVSPALVAAMLKAASDWNPGLSDPARDEYGIARWTPRVLWYYMPPDQRRDIPRPPFPPEVSVPAVGRYLCKYSSALQGVPGDRGLLLAAAYATSDARVLQARGIPPEVLAFERRVEAALNAYRPATLPSAVAPPVGAPRPPRPSRSPTPAA